MPFLSPNKQCQSTECPPMSVAGKGLDLYQVLAPNAFSYLEEFIPVIRKTVQSQVHSRVMTQFQWHDGTTKNIHVDLSLLFEYQKQLGAVVKLYEKRIDWLSCGSRKFFGSVAENKYVSGICACVFANNPTGCRWFRVLEP